MINVEVRRGGKHYRSEAEGQAERVPVTILRERAPSDGNVGRPTLVVVQSILVRLVACAGSVEQCQRVVGHVRKGGGDDGVRIVHGQRVVTGSFRAADGGIARCLKLGGVCAGGCEGVEGDFRRAVSGDYFVNF